MYDCIHYILMILMIHQCATFFTAEEVNIIYTSISERVVFTRVVFSVEL